MQRRRWDLIEEEDSCTLAKCSVVQVLAGVTVLFSALVPLGQDPRAHSLGQLAEQFGAKCATQEDTSVSHVVAANSGSAKAQWAIAHGRHLVSRHWYADLLTQLGLQIAISPRAP